jgi:predicted dehydrogenase
MRLLILGTGGMAGQHANHFAAIDGVELVAGVDLDEKTLAEFAAEHKIGRQFTSLDEALAWGQFDAVANVTPDPVHFATTLSCLAAGKHVFCEKPLATDHPKALEMTEAAEKAGLVNMVNLTYRNVPQLQKARQLVEAGTLGEIRHIEASYLQSWLVSEAWGKWYEDAQWLWRLSKSHGSNGVLGDVGIHILDFAVFGSTLEIEKIFCRLHTYHKAPNDQIGEYKLDANDSFSMSVEFAGGVLGVIHATRWATGHLNELKLRIYGDKGGMEVVHRTDGSGLKICTGEGIDTQTWHEIDAPDVETNYQRFARAVANKTNDEPSFRHATGLQKALDIAIVSDKDMTDQKLA